MTNDQQRSNDIAEEWLHHVLGDGFQPDAPADAWQRLEPNLPGKKERRPPVFWWLFAFGATVALAVFWFLKKPESQPVPTDLPQNAQPIAQVSEARASQFFEEGTTAAALQNQAQQSAEPVFKSHFSEKKASKNATAVPQAFPKTSQHDASVFPENSTASNQAAEHFGQNGNPGVFELPENPAGHRADAALEPLLQKPLERLAAAAQPLPGFQFSPAEVVLKTPGNRRFWFGIEAAPTMFFQKNMPAALPGLAFAEMPTRPAQGWQAGVSLAFEPLKNWRVALGLQHFRQSHAARHTATLRLMDGVCLNPNDPGLKEYEFNYALLSGNSGQSDITLRLQQQAIGSTMPMDESFTLDMKTVHRSAAWRVPLSGERRFGAGRWQGFVRGGAAVEFAEKSEMTVTHFTEACQDLCFQSDHIPTIQASAASKISVGWLAGAGIERRIGSRAALRFEPFWVGKKHGLQTGLSVGLLFSN